MVITYFGHEYFKVQFGEITLAFNPISKDSRLLTPKRSDGGQAKLKTSRFGADIALISIDDEDSNGADQVSFGERQAFVIRGPGEYEVKDVFIKGYLSNGKNKKGKLNTIYTISLEGMNICFLGALSTKDIGADTKAALGDIDILFTPIGGTDVLSAAEAYKLAVSLGARLIIPMHYLPAAQGSAAQAGLPTARAAQAGGETTLKAFLKEGGESKMTAQEKLTLKKKDLEGKEGEIVVLAANV